MYGCICTPVYSAMMFAITIIVQKMVSREVTHFWFTGWPDCGTPSAQVILDFLVHVQKHTNLDIPGPIVVHCRYRYSIPHYHGDNMEINFTACSGGIGRTGVFIAADIAMQQLDREGEIDLLKILTTLRQDRGGMIQTKEQYVFLHKVNKLNTTCKQNNACFPFKDFTGICKHSWCSREKASL